MSCTPLDYVRPLLLLLAGAALSVVQAQPFALNFSEPTMDRWMYPFNATPGSRASAPVFGTLGNEAGVDSRHGQFLLGFDTFSQVATNRGPANYLIQRARVTATINRDRSFRYDPTQDTYYTYHTNHPAYTADTDPGRPIELFGAGFRNGFTVETFPEDGPFGSPAAGERNVYAAGYSTTGALVDVGNNVGKSDPAFPSFEVAPFAIGKTPEVIPGDLVPSGTKIEFDLNLEDPLVQQYLQEALNSGRLRVTITGLHISGFGGTPAWPDFYTRDSLVGSPPTLEIDGVALRDTDTDANGLPDDWEEFHFGSLHVNAAEDADHDGQSNMDEFRAGNNPTNAASVQKILSIHQNEEGVRVLRFRYVPSHRYAIEYSEDLSHWATVEGAVFTYELGSAVVEWPDDGSLTGGIASRRFYRIRSL